ncbi:MAG: N-acetylneuraminate synthase family protein [Mariniphaga sp.]|nr:N-acetylneuraminate synthase family protein [Mariniphaga sp.]
MNYTKPKVISEIGCNHMGQLNVAKELILMSKNCGADIVKFQKRTNNILLTHEQYNTAHQNPHNSYGSTYGQHREFLEFSVEQHHELKNYAESIGINYSSSVWDIQSAKEIISLNPDFIKVPSACNNNIKLLTELRDNYSGEVQVSLGMTTMDEEESVIKIFEETNQSKKRLILYSCTSGYPVPFEDICLLEITRLYNNYENRVKGIGFSGHHLGIAVDIAAYTLGAKYIERHFTKDRTLKGTDHAASLEPTGLQKLVRDLNHTYTALRCKKSEILEIEYEQRKKLKSRNV